MDITTPILPGIDLKAGVLIPGAFTGTPKRATVFFSTPFASSDYAVVFAPLTDGSKTFSCAAELKTPAGFVVNIHSNNVANLIEIGWQATHVGE